MSLDSTLTPPITPWSVRLGQDGKMEIVRQFPGQEHALSAYGAIDIEPVVSSWARSSTQASVCSGFQLAMNGSEGTFKVVDGVVLAASHGSIDITSSG